MSDRFRPPGTSGPARPGPDGRGAGKTPVRTAWTCLGALLSVVLVVSGLVLVGFIVLVVVGMNSFGSNK